MIHRQLASQGLSRVGSVFQCLARRVYTPAQAERVRPWVAANGDKTLRLDYDLGPGSIVFDVGGYEGQWASDIVAMYCCTVHLFEPVPAFARRIVHRFRHNPRVHVYTFGLAGTDRTERISHGADASSVFKPDANGSDIRLVGFPEFVREHAVERIDLMKINIEGGEYELLECLLDCGWARRVHDIQVQFHDFIPDAERRMQVIQGRLRQTHEPTYQFPFVWENWRLR